MKKIAIGLLGLMVIFFTSCEKEFSEENTFSSAAGDFRATIDGVNWVANILSNAKRENGLITLTGKSFDRKTITLTVADSGVHSYSFNSTSATNVAVYEDSAVTPIAAWSTNQWLAPGIYGDVNITSIDTIRKTMSGTFTINVYRALDDQQKSITNGFFTKIPYTNVITAPTDTFRVNVNASPFTYSTVSANSSGSSFVISAARAGGTASVNLTFDNSLAPGDYPFDGLTTVGVYTEGLSDLWISDTGTLTVIENNTSSRRIRGSFSFNGVSAAPIPQPDVSLTDGYFSIRY